MVVRSYSLLLLAGGLSRRMGGGDKNLMELGGKPVLAHVLDRIDCGSVPTVLNANGDADRYAGFDLPVVPDVIDGFAGPLAGILTGLEWTAAHYPDCSHMISLATDAPFIPRDLTTRLVAAIQDGAEMAQAASQGRRHPVFAIWPLTMRAALRDAVMQQGVRKIDDFTADYVCAIVPFEAMPDPFMNLNRPEDFVAAEERLHPS